MLTPDEIDPAMIQVRATITADYVLYKEDGKLKVCCGVKVPDKPGEIALCQPAIEILMKLFAQHSSHGFEKALDVLVDNVKSGRHGPFHKEAE